MIYIRPDDAYHKGYHSFDFRRYLYRPFTTTIYYLISALHASTFLFLLTFCCLGTHFCFMLVGPGRDSD